MNALSPKQEAFCQEYIVDLNATQAAIRAGYSPPTAQEQSSRLLSKAIIMERVNKLKEERAIRTQISSDGVLRELGRIGYADVKHIFKEDGTVKHISEWPEELTRACAGLEVVETFENLGQGNKVWTGYIKKVKFWDKPKALELMGKNQKLFTDKIEHSGSVTLEALVAGSNRIEGDE